jgi:protein-S-isoprenylcysteine O-methyltransferase Ste14
VHLLPILRIDFANQWILLAIYLVPFLVFVFRLPAERRKWLFRDPKESIHGLKKILLRSSQLLAFILIALICLSPMPSELQAIELVGLVLYAAGVVLVPISIYYFGHAPLNSPVADGPYRYSRNPQWVGLVLVLLGLATSTRSIVLISLVLLVAGAYHIQILAEEQLCLDKYGAPFERYMKTVPRYLLFK